MHKAPQMKVLKPDDSGGDDVEEEIRVIDAS
jgi:hypothetical protein